MGRGLEETPMAESILDHEDLARRIKGLRAGGKRVVVTNGCFDLLHVGHIRCLKDAASRGDCLVVAINSDKSVRALKGAGRPVQPQAERAEILIALRGVDYVTVFDEPTVATLLRQLRPQVVAKGTDYDAKNFPEREVLAEIGAELVIVGDSKDHSTIDLIGRIRASKGGGPSGKSATKSGSAARGAKPAAAKKGKSGAKPSAKALVERVLAAKASAAKRRGKSLTSEAHA